MTKIHGGNASTDTTAFDEIVALFEDQPVCEIKTADGRCRRWARFMIDCHGCGRGLVCTKHMRAFTRQVPAGEPAQCNRCGREFATIDDAVSVVPL